MALLAIGVLAVATSGPLIVATAAPALAIAFWRNAFGSLAVMPVALIRRWRELVALGRRQWAYAAGAGVLLAGHFAAWVPSLSLTSVASSTALVTTQPVWAALLARLSGHHVPRRAWWGIAVALSGVVVLTGVDFSLAPRALAGDLLALVGGVFGAAYMSVGAQVRRHTSTASYTLVCYGACSLLLLVVCVASGARLVGYDAETWAKLLALTVGAQLLGHTLFNVVLRTTSATVVSLVILLEVPGAAVIAAAWLGQVPPLAALPALVLLLTGIGLVVGSRPREEPSSPFDPVPSE